MNSGGSPRLDAGRRAAVIGVIVNATLAGVKAVAGILGNAYVLVADAIESLTDIAGSGVVYGGLHIAARPPDEDHPYGHGKAESLAGLVVAAGLLIAAIVIAIQSIRELMTPHDAPAPFTLVVLIVVVIVKEILSRRVARVGADLGSTAIVADAWHHRSDAITSAAAFFGITIALVGGPGYEGADDIAALFAAGIVAWNAMRIGREAINEVMDAAPQRGVIAALRDAALTVPGVRGVEKCHVRKMGVQYYADLHLTVDARISVAEGHMIAHRVKDAMRAANRSLGDVLIHVEPDPIG